MTIAPSGVRRRLTLWHAAVLGVIVCVFSVGILLFVRVRLYRGLDEQIASDLTAIEKVYREETGDLGELSHRMGITFEVTEGPTVLYRAPGWPPAGPARYRFGRFQDAAHWISTARDEAPVRQTLRSLALILAVGAPGAIGLALVGGYLLAGRVLAPVGAVPSAPGVARVRVQLLCHLRSLGQ